MSTCRPHDWHEPLPFDVALTCRRCGRVLDIATAEPWRLTAIARAHGATFVAALVRCTNLGHRAHNQGDDEWNTR